MTTGRRYLQQVPRMARWTQILTAAKKQRSRVAAAARNGHVHGLLCNNSQQLHQDQMFREQGTDGNVGSDQQERDATGEGEAQENGARRDRARKRQLSAAEKIILLCCVTLTEKLKDATTKKIILLMNALAGAREELVTFEMYKKGRAAAANTFAPQKANCCSMCYSDIGKETGVCRQIACGQRFRRMGATSEHRHVQIQTFSLEQQLAELIKKHINHLDLLRAEQRTVPTVMQSVKDSPRYVNAGKRHWAQEHDDLLLIRL